MPGVTTVLRPPPEIRTNRRSSAPDGISSFVSRWLMTSETKREPIAPDAARASCKLDMSRIKFI